MYARTIKGRELTFDFAEGLIHDNLLIADRETNSVWSQLEGRAIHGPMTGTPLPVIASMQTTWKFWRDTHPETRVMVVPGEEGRPYTYRNRRPGTPRPKELPSGHDTTALGLGLTHGGETMFFPFVELEKIETPLRLRMAGREVVIHYDKGALTAWATGAKGELLPGVLAYQFGWMDFNPDSSVYRAGSGGN